MDRNEELRRFNQSLIAEFRANGGKAKGWEDNPLLLLTTIGARSGQPHTIPLSYMTDGDHIVVFAAAAGAPSHPAWYRNLVAHPEVTVELGRERWQTRAVAASGQERARLFSQRVKEAPFVGEVQRTTGREIPVVILPRGGA
jgi:deazaflavin-dependent oxidoreductase (nitroreductase family)